MRIWQSSHHTERWFPDTVSKKQKFIQDNYVLSDLLFSLISVLPVKLKHQKEVSLVQFTIFLFLLMLPTIPPSLSSKSISCYRHVKLSTLKTSEHSCWLFTAGDNALLHSFPWNLCRTYKSLLANPPILHTHTVGSSVNQPVVLTILLKQSKCSHLWEFKDGKIYFHLSFWFWTSTTFISTIFSWKPVRTLSDYHVKLVFRDNGQDLLMQKLHVITSSHCWRIVLPTWLSDLQSSVQNF